MMDAYYASDHVDNSQITLEITKDAIYGDVDKYWPVSR